MKLRITRPLALAALAVLLLGTAVLTTGVRDGWGSSVNLPCCAAFAIWVDLLDSELRRSISRRAIRRDEIDQN